jgi:hypothetical protein
VPAVVTNDSKATVAVLIGMEIDNALTSYLGARFGGQNLDAPCLGQVSRDGSHALGDGFDGTEDAFHVLDAGGVMNPSVGVWRIWNPDTIPMNP